MADNDTKKKTPAKIGKLVYPFQKAAEAGKSGAKPTEIDDPQVYFSALSNAQDGFYPIGANGQWHGGIHFDAQTGTALAQAEGVRCIGDGEVVAYQVESKYAEVEYGTGKAAYSRGFVLVRHRLELPPAPKTTATPGNTPAPAGGTPAAAPATTQPASSPAASKSEPTPAKTEEPSLIFYSAYLHLLDWAGYQALDKNKPRPAYWGKATYAVGDKAKDQDRTKNPFIPEGGVGLNLRNAKGDAAGYAARGAKLELGEENPKKKGYFAIKRVVSGTVVPAEATGLFAYKKELTEAGSEPAAKDQVYVLPEPVKISAGALIGYLGTYQRYIDTSPLADKTLRPLVQVDVFTAEDIKAFMSKSRERAKLLDAKQRTLLKVDVGAKLATPTQPDQQIDASDTLTPAGGKGAGKWVQAKRTSSGATVWVEKAQLNTSGATTGRALAAWSQFPLNVGQGDGPGAGFIRVAAIKHLKNSATDANGVRWWEIDVGQTDGSSKMGWACEKDHPKVTLCSPWDWPGFEYVEADTTTPEVLYARHVVTTKQARPDEQAALQAKAAEADGGPLFSRVCDVIDLDHDRKLTTDELRKALRQPWLAEAISRLVIHHTSEWGTPKEQWDAIDKDIPEPRKADWEKEKQRIQSLQWWKDVAGPAKLPADAKVYYFHPIGLISNFTAQGDCKCGSCMGKIFSRYKWTRKRQNFPDKIYYGPVYAGKKKLNSFTGWESLINEGKATEDEKAVVIAMSSNEGAMDAVQAWDWQTLSAGAMQKTVTPEGYGELPQQISEFKKENPALFDEIFGDCGWSIKEETGGARIYYSSEATNNSEITGEKLYDFIKEGFQLEDSGFPKESKPLAAISAAMIHEEYQKKQVADFIGRMRSALLKKPRGYPYAANEYFQSRLGRALVLDHDVNAPGNVVRDIGKSLDKLKANHPGLQNNPALWGANRSTYEQELIEIYGPSRNMNSPAERYEHLRGLL
ncbi:calcium-binding protein [Xanthomonas maliensis]|uniref:calcium-binding protein n=1 Tax=Xanthomonas maliensis TaxID=1321368 RepID=UPI00126484FA|nr:calcium-binding protein [Xanthomonas maliensis]KAB7769643.1 calcium-binding protein [Xanthomonas maliensis]